MKTIDKIASVIVVIVLLVVGAYKGNNEHMTVIDMPVPSVPADYQPPGGEMKVPEYELPSSITTYTDEEFTWMRMNIYFESRNQSFIDMISVGFVVLNRVDDPRYPNTVKDVVSYARRDEQGNPIQNKCHFSWYCDGVGDNPNLDNIIEREAWDAAGRAAHIVLTRTIEDPTDGAVYYHAPGVLPYWVQQAGYAEKTVQVGHVFYKRS